MKRAGFYLLFVVVGLAVSGCTRPAAEEELLKLIPLDGTESTVTRDGVSVDADSTDGNGSLRLSADKSESFKLFEIADLQLEDARLIYRAKVKSEGVTGKAYLEMWVRLPGQGEFFSRGLNQPIVGTTGWSDKETPFFLKKGQQPDLIRLNLVIEGKGTVWIDDIRILKAPLR